MDKKAAYKDFTQRLKLLISKNPQLITLTLSNIFTMRLVGNKTHGDLAEIAIAEFINQYMYDFKSIHVGKDLFRAKQSEEDIQIINEVTKAEFSVSLKAYGVRYGGVTANALQRGFWTHTKNALPFFDSLTNGWIDYSLNPVLVKLFSHALLATRKSHEVVLEELKRDIEEQKLGMK
jgi:hypothetical protein